MNYFTKVKISNKEPHGYALLIHLQSRRLINTTEMIMRDSGIISTLLERVCEIYFQLQEKNYIHLDETKGRIYFKRSEQLHKGLEQVSVVLYFI